MEKIKYLNINLGNMKEYPSTIEQEPKEEAEIQPYEIENPKDWQDLASDLLREGRMHRVDSIKINGSKLIWRGMNPEDILNLLFGKSSNITLSSERPNVTSEWQTAISYTQKQPGIRMNAAIGFLPGENLSLQKATLSEDIPAEACDLQENNFIANGEIFPENIRYLAIRFHGKKGAVPKPIIYKIEWGKPSGAERMAA